MANKLIHTLNSLHFLLISLVVSVEIRVNVSIFLTQHERETERLGMMHNKNATR